MKNEQMQTLANLKKSILSFNDSMKKKQTTFTHPKGHSMKRTDVTAGDRPGSLAAGPYI